MYCTPRTIGASHAKPSIWKSTEKCCIYSQMFIRAPIVRFPFHTCMQKGNGKRNPCFNHLPVEKLRSSSARTAERHRKHRSRDGTKLHVQKRLRGSLAQFHNTFHSTACYMQGPREKCKCWEKQYEANSCSERYQSLFAPPLVF